jgi:hypothetical protein
MFEVSLTRRSEKPRMAFLRELSGADEMLASRTEPGVATRVLERLLVDAPAAAVGSKDAWSMSIGDRDRLIAGLYLNTFDDAVEGRIECGSCGKAFGLEFSLRTLIDEIERDAETKRAELGVEGPDEDGTYRLRDGTRFRLPTPDDERQIAGLEENERADALLRRCIIDQASEVIGHAERREALESAFDALAPLLSLPVPTSCALCGAQQQVDFDVVRYFLIAISRERVLLTREIHALARAYHWSFEEIARLPRSQRHAHVELVEIERGTLEPFE